MSDGPTKETIERGAISLFNWIHQARITHLKSWDQLTESIREDYRVAAKNCYLAMTTEGAAEK